MGAVSVVARERSPESDRTDVRDDEQLFGSIVGDIARLLWPKKTAANVAALIGCSERAAEMYLAADREWSGDAIAAIVAEICKRHGMRNIKIKGRP
jgi:hypothetical protein